MDVLAYNDHEYTLAGLRGIERKYAFIDFETTILPNTTLPNEKVEEAIKRDVNCLGRALESRIRVRIVFFPIVLH